MFSIVFDQQQYPTYILQDDETKARVSIVPDRGGIVISWQINETEIFYLDRERFTNPELSVRGGIPLLFPICGNLVDDSYTWKEQSYKLVQHGFARNLPWKVTNQSTNGEASLTVTLASNEQTLSVYPFNFKIDYTYILKGNKLELRFSHTNLGNELMPFSTGTHPYFLVNDKSKLSLAIPATEYATKGDATPQQFNGTFDFEQDEIDVAFTTLNGRSAVVTDSERNLELIVSYDDHFSTLVFWTVKGKDFYCLEPWSSPRNSMNTGVDLLTIEPGQTVETIVGFEVKLK